VVLYKVAEHLHFVARVRIYCNETAIAIATKSKFYYFVLHIKVKR